MFSRKRIFPAVCNISPTYWLIRLCKRKQWVAGTPDRNVNECCLSSSLYNRLIALQVAAFSLGQNSGCAQSLITYTPVWLCFVMFMRSFHLLLRCHDVYVVSPLKWRYQPLAIFNISPDRHRSQRRWERLCRCAAVRMHCSTLWPQR